MQGQTVDGAVDTVYKPLATLTQSLRDWLLRFATDSNLTTYGNPLLIAGLLFLLFIHFVAFVLVNNTGIQGWSKGFSQGLFELQVWLQTVVIKLIVYYSFFVIGLFQGASNSSYAQDVFSLGPYIALLVVLYILNKTALIFTGIRNPEYTLGPAGQPGGIFTSSKNKWIYTPTIWLQTVTDIIIQQSVPGAFFGYAAGKFIVAFRGGSL